MQKSRWVFFDLGSTLLDETSRTNERIEATAARLRIHRIAFEEMLAQAASQHAYAVNIDLPDGTAWASWPNRLDPLYPGVPDLLQALRGSYRLGIIANHGADTAQRLGIAPCFDVIVTSEASGLSKPDPRMFALALERAGCAPEEAVMVGDRLDNDIAPAKRLGMGTIWIKQGWGGRAVPASEAMTPDCQVTTLAELTAALEYTWSKSSST